MGILDIFLEPSDIRAIADTFKVYFNYGRGGRGYLSRKLVDVTEYKNVKVGWYLYKRKDRGHAQVIMYIIRITRPKIKYYYVVFKSIGGKWCYAQYKGRKTRIPYAPFIRYNIVKKG